MTLFSLRFLLLSFLLGITSLSLPFASSQSLPSEPDCRGLASVRAIETQRYLTVSRFFTLQEHLVSNYNKVTYSDQLFAQIPLPDPLFGTVSVFDEKHIIMRPENASFYTLVAPRYTSFFDNRVRECTFTSGMPQLLLSFSNTSDESASTVGFYSSIGYNNTQVNTTTNPSQPLNTSGLSLSFGAHTLIDLHNHFYFFAIAGLNSDAQHIDIPESSLKTGQNKDITESGSLQFTGKTGIGASIPVNSLLFNTSLNLAYYQNSLKEALYPADDTISITQKSAHSAWIVPSLSLHLQQYFSGFDTTRIGLGTSLHAGYSLSVGDPSWTYNVGFTKQTINLSNSRFDVAMRGNFIIQIAQSFSLDFYARIGRTFNTTDFSSAFLDTGVSFESLF